MIALIRVKAFERLKLTGDGKIDRAVSTIGKRQVHEVQMLLGQPASHYAVSLYSTSFSIRYFVSPKSELLES